MSPWKEFVYISVPPAFMAVTQGSGLDFLARIVNGACIHESPRILANKEAVPNELHPHTTALDLSPAKRKQAKRPIPVSPWNGLSLQSSQLLPKGPASSQPASRADCHPPVRTEMDSGTAPTTGDH